MCTTRSTPAAAASRPIRPGPCCLHRGEVPVQDAHAVHHHRGALDGAGHRGLVRHVGGQARDLAHPAHRVHALRAHGVARRDADHVVLARQTLHHLPADEAAAAEDRRHLAHHEKSLRREIQYERPLPEPSVTIMSHPRLTTRAAASIPPLTSPLQIAQVVEW
jgi:hypothetical protein